jgi:hypothetical protein
MVAGAPFSHVSAASAALSMQLRRMQLLFMVAGLACCCGLVSLSASLRLVVIQWGRSASLAHVAA